ncbi:unnamed protein product [Acanthocheilonema viteae]|uniref:tRNA (32-2'-O)-methyltransferase regulator THADA n=1 Tax=Acanthocheilonema viteae TaxID=6277 RepID=A0A498RZI2_ACAVI|nr:unnamed protein product [Acanthocheilonema viteae]
MLCMTIENEKSRCHSLNTLSTSCFAFLFRKPTGDWFQACCTEHDCFLVDACIPAILFFSEKHSSNVGAILDISKALARLMIILKEEKRALRECEEDKLLDFVCRFWDYISEAVCHDCVRIFESLMKLHLTKCVSNGPLSSWAKNVGKFLIDSSSSCRSRYRCILVYSKIVPSFSKDLADNFYKELYTSLSNPTLVVVVSELIVFDIVKNLDNLDRLQLHSYLLCASLQSPIKAVRSAVQKRLLPEFSKNSLLLDWVIEELKTFQSVLSKVVNDSKSTLVMIYPNITESVYDRIGLETSLYIAKFCLFHQKGNGNVLEWTSFIDESLVISALLSASTQLLIRIRESGQNILKNGSDEDKLKPYVDFICWLRDLCFQNLMQHANFNRRIMALKMLEHLFLENYLANDNKDMFFKFLSSKLRPTEEQIRRVICCLDDSYHLCQISALRLLSSSFFETCNFDFASYFSETKHQLFSIRSLFTFTASYRLRFYLKKNPDNLQNVFQYLLNLCKDRVKLISQDFLMIITNQGFVYSVLSAVSVVLEFLDFQSSLKNDWSVPLINRDLLPLCFQISELVSPVVNSMSPEGFVPDDYISIIVNVKDFEKSKENTNFCQILLASCWRSHKYVSEIFYIIITKWLGNSALSSETVRHICSYYWRQLTECKHCGAVEAAVEGFEALCVKLWSFALAGSPEFMDLPQPEAWVKQIIDLIDNRKNVLCATRRSAGLPHLIASILAKEPIANNAQCLKKTMISLLENEGRSYKAQVHSINIMRAIFLNSCLSEAVLCYIEPAANVCFTCFGSSNWALRSAASQLFAALIRRIFDDKFSSEIKNLLMNSKALRLEFWRALSKSTKAKFTEIEMIQLAVEDIRNSGPFVERYILTLFLNSATADLAGLFDSCFLKHFLYELITMRRQSNQHLANLLLIKLDHNEWRFEWLYSSAVNEDQKIQSIAIRALELLLKRGNPDFQLCKIIVLLLKSENVAIREKAAELCSHVASLKIASLNPEILFWWFVQYYPEVEEFIHQCGSFDSNEHTHLFDACVSNPYIEAIPICSEYLRNVMQLISCL